VKLVRIAIAAARAVCIEEGLMMSNNSKLIQEGVIENDRVFRCEKKPRRWLPTIEVWSSNHRMNDRPNKHS